MYINLLYTCTCVQLKPDDLESLFLNKWRKILKLLIKTVSRKNIPVGLD